MTLLDLSRDGYRSNGGVGFCIDTGESAGLHAVRSSTFDVSALLSCGFEQSELDDLHALLCHIRLQEKLEFGFVITSAELIRRHCGFGSGTYARLACISMLGDLNGATFERAKMLKWSGRGGASGVGISTFFDGGMCFDLGRTRDAAPLTSSDFQSPGFIRPTPLASVPMPNWRCGIIMPPDAQSIRLDDERKFFARMMPLTDAAVHQATYHALLGVYASVIDNNFASFCSAINAIQAVEWKAAEIALHGDRVSGLINDLRSHGCDAAGMSSLGPCVYFFAKDFDHVMEGVKRDVGHSLILSATPRNEGCRLLNG